MTSPEPDGVDVLLTRPEPDNAGLAQRLESSGARVLQSPLLVEKALAPRLPEPDGFAGVVVTSRRALRAFERPKTAPAWRRMACFAVGEATAAAARDAGFDDLHIGPGTGADLARLIAATHGAGKLLYPAARLRNPDLEAALAASGVAVEPLVVYDMEPVEALSARVEAALAQGTVAGAAFYSRRSAGVFSGLLRAPRFDTARDKLVCLCLSQACAEPLIAAGFGRQAIATRPAGPAMDQLVTAFAAEIVARRVQRGEC